MLLHTGEQVVRVADIERAVIRAGEEVGGEEHGSGVGAVGVGVRMRAWTPAFAGVSGA